jgi:hypothetical protein
LEQRALIKLVRQRGDTRVANSEDGKRCEEIMVKKLGR